MNEYGTKVKILTGITPGNISPEILNAETPIILKDFTSAWPIVIAGKKSVHTAMSYLQPFDNGAAVNASYVPHEAQGRVYYNDDMTGFNFESSQQPVSTILADIAGAIDSDLLKSVYFSAPIYQCLPELANQIPFPAAPDNALVNIWIGNKSRIAAHYDFAQNVACCVVGRRKFTLFPPEQGKNLYVGPIDKSPGGPEISTVDFHHPDFEKHPKFKYALQNAYIADLAPGDALILPSMWWHHVEGLDDVNILITHWWRNSPGFMGRPNNALLHAILSLRDLPISQRDAWKEIFDHYIFNFDNNNFDHIPEQAKSILASPLDELSARKIRAELQNLLRR